VGRSEQALRAGRPAVRDARDRPAHRRERPAVRGPGQKGDCRRPADRSALGPRARDPRLRPARRHRRPTRGHPRLQREEKAALQRQVEIPPAHAGICVAMRPVGHSGHCSSRLHREQSQQCDAARAPCRRFATRHRQRKQLITPAACTPCRDETTWMRRRSVQHATYTPCSLPLFPSGMDLANTGNGKSHSWARASYPRIVSVLTLTGSSHA
jgi:hypothetical protein